MPLFRFGNFKAGEFQAEMQTAEAIEHAKTLAGPGYVWQLDKKAKHWRIVGNYQAGRVWNGQHKIVPADVKSWVFFSKRDS